MDVKPSEDEMSEKLVHIKYVVVEIQTFMNTSSATQPISCHLSAATALSQVMLGLVQQVNSNGGRFDTREDALQSLGSLCALQADTLVKDDWFRAVELMEHIKTLGYSRLLEEFTASSMPSLSLLNAYRVQLVFHCLKTIGRQSYMLLSKDKTMATQETYMSSYQQDVVDKFALLFDVATVPLESMPTILSDYMLWTEKRLDEVIVDVANALCRMDAHVKKFDPLAFENKKNGLRDTLKVMKNKSELEATMSNELGEH